MTRLARHLEQRGWPYTRFRREFEKTAWLMGLGRLTVGRRQYNRWLNGDVAHPRRDARSVLERLFCESIETLLSPRTPTEAPMTAQPMTVALAVVIHDEHILLTRRVQPVGPNHIEWVYPAGMVKPEEDPADAAEREVFEETGVSVKVAERIHERVLPSGALGIYFRCDYMGGEASNRSPRENREVVWVPIAEFPDYVDLNYVSPYVLRLLCLDVEWRSGGST